MGVSSPQLGAPALTALAMWLYTGLGCARSPKKMLTDRRIVDRSKPEDDVTSSHSGGESGVGGNIGEFPLPHHGESKLSSAPTREASFVQEGVTRRRLADSLPFEAVNANVSCHGCGKLVTGALYMGHDRAYCSAGACDKVGGIRLPTRLGPLVRWPSGTRSGTPVRFLPPPAGEAHRTQAVESML